MGYRMTNGQFRRNISTTISGIGKIRADANNTDVYSTIYLYKEAYKDGDPLYAPLYFDLDCKDLLNASSENNAFEVVREDALRVIAILEAIMNVGQEYLKIYFSGGKGIHIVVDPICLGILPHPQLNQIFHIIVKDIQRYTTHGCVDTRIYDNKRLFRLPNSIHGKTGRYKIPLTAHELRTLSFEDIKLLSSQPRMIDVPKATYSTKANRMYVTYINQWEKEQREIEDRKNKTYSTTFKYTPPCISNILENGIEEGERNNTLAVISSFFKQQGYSEAETLERLTKFNADMVKPSLHQREIDTIVDSIYAGEYKYGCKALIDLNRCNGECKIKQNLERKRKEKQKGAKK